MRVPVLKQVDVIVVGGCTGGVAAATALAKAGLKVFMGVPETYFGADICKFARLWQDVEGATAKKLLGNAKKGAPLRPMDVKRKLDEAVVAAGIDFLFGVMPADVIVEDAEKIGGVMFTSKTGAFAVRGKVVIDATWEASLWRTTGLSMRKWNGGDVEFTRVLFGTQADDAKAKGKKLTPFAKEKLDAWAYSTTLRVKSDTPEAWAEAEAQMRDRFWSKQLAGSSDASFYLPPHGVIHKSEPCEFGKNGLPLDAFKTLLPNVYVIGPSANVSRKAAAKLADASVAIAEGEKLGKLLAKELPRIAACAANASVGGFHGAMPQEACSDPRMLREAVEWIEGEAVAPELPVLAEMDVVVVGGGTGGAPAGIAAAREGAKTLVLESLHGLGGVGTLGYITVYYHGFRRGFTSEITHALWKWHGEGFDTACWNAEHKAEWFRQEIRKAGGQVWWNAIVSGAVMDGTRIIGVIVNTPWGRGIVKAGMVIDATGNADVAAAAGAPTTVVSEHDLAVQGTGLPPKPLRPAYTNTDYTFTDDTDGLDTTRAFVVARQKFADRFDLAQIVDTRERRQIVGDVTLTPLDVYTGRTWGDAICLSRSNFDSHGFTVHPLFFVLPPDRTELDAWTPIRTFLPKGFQGLAVTGLGLSAQRDVMPVLRMQPDIQNHAYVLGIAAVMALKTGHDFRAIDIKALQRRLVEKDILPSPALLMADVDVIADERVAEAVFGDLNNHAELAAIMSSPATALPLLNSRMEVETDAGMRLRIAKIMAVMGDANGAKPLQKAATAGWDTGWDYTGMGQFGRSMSPVDDAIAGLAMLGDATAAKKIFAQAEKLTAKDAFSHFRALALYGEAIRNKACAKALAELLMKPGIAGHCWTSLNEELGDIPESTIDTATRNRSLRELFLARALYRCGDCDGLGERILTDYTHDIRGHFARHAAMVLRDAK